MGKLLSQTNQFNAKKQAYDDWPEIQIETRLQLYATFLNYSSVKVHIPDINWSEQIMKLQNMDHPYDSFNLEGEADIIDPRAASELL